MTQLSPHFSLEELCFSDTAIRLHIDNDPPAALHGNLKRLANGLERVRQLLNNNAIIVSSGHRCKRLNEAVHGQPNSQHVEGNAVDFRCPTYGPPSQIVKLIQKSGIEFDQCILEFPGSPNGGWVHISFSDNPRKQVLAIDAKGTRSFA